MTPAGLGKRGRHLWQDLGAHDLSAPYQGLVLEAARLLDRLEGLDQVLRGEPGAWVEIHVPELGDARLVVNSAMDQARQMAIAYSQIVEKLRVAGVVGKSQQGEGGGLLDRLRERAGPV